jgi:hypothetical protein
MIEVVRFSEGSSLSFHYCYNTPQPKPPKPFKITVSCPVARGVPAEVQLKNFSLPILVLQALEPEIAM